MIKTFIVEEERAFRMLVEIDVPDDVQWQTSDYDMAIDEAVARSVSDGVEWTQWETHRSWRGEGLDRWQLERWQK